MSFCGFLPVSDPQFTILVVLDNPTKYTFGGTAAAPVFKEIAEHLLVLKGVKPEEMSKITIAYEPVWAIGTGKTATPEDADNAHAFIRETVARIYSKDIAEKLIIQYGGSVKAENVKALMAKENIDGALVGGASLSVEKFLPIIAFNK